MALKNLFDKNTKNDIPPFRNLAQGSEVGEDKIQMWRNPDKKLTLGGLLDLG